MQALVEGQKGILADLLHLLRRTQQPPRETLDLRCKGHLQDIEGFAVARAQPVPFLSVVIPEHASSSHKTLRTTGRKGSRPLAADPESAPKTCLHDRLEVRLRTSVDITTAGVERAGGDEVAGAASPWGIRLWMVDHVGPLLPSETPKPYVLSS